MSLFHVLPPLDSLHSSDALAYLPNVKQGSEPWLYHLDQVARFTHWRHTWVEVGSLDLAAPRGSEHGLLVIHPITRTVLGGWDHVRRAQAAGQTRIAGYVGEGPSRRWLPQSEQERLNREVFLRIDSLKNTFLKTSGGKAEAIRWRSGEVSISSSAHPETEDLRDFLCSSHGWDPNAVGASGRTLLVGLLESCWYGGPAVIGATTEALRRGALPLRASHSLIPNPGEICSPLRVAMNLLASSIRQKKYLQDFLTPLIDQLLSTERLWEPSGSQALLADLFQDFPEDQELSPSLGKLRLLWRSALLDQALPKAVPALATKPRF